MLNKNGSNIDTQNRVGYTALFFAAVNGYEQAVQMLIDLKADIDIKDSYGKTALIYAQERGYDSIVELLTKASEG